MENHHYLRLIIYAFLPVILFILGMIFAPILLMCLSRVDRERYSLCRSYFQRVILMTGIGTYVVYPAMMLVFFQSIHCVDIAGQERLWANADISCETDDFKKLYWAVSIPAITIWIGLAPFLSLLCQVRSFDRYWKAPDNMAGEITMDTHYHS